MTHVLQQRRARGGRAQLRRPVHSNRQRVRERESERGAAWTDAGAAGPVQQRAAAGPREAGPVRRLLQRALQSQRVARLRRSRQLRLPRPEPPPASSGAQASRRSTGAHRGEPEMNLEDFASRLGSSCGGPNEPHLGRERARAGRALALVLARRRLALSRRSLEGALFLAAPAPRGAHGRVARITHEQPLHLPAPQPSRPSVFS